MRVRVVNRTIAALLAESAWLNPLKDPLFAWELWSHKVLRYASPWLWGASLITSAFLAGHDWFYAAVFLIQSAVLVAGIAGFVLQTHSGSLRLLSKPYYFLLSNLASLLATLAYARGRRVITWETVR
jgi:hypothetical protein